MIRVKHKRLPHYLPLDLKSCPCLQVEPPPPPLEEDRSGRGLRELTPAASIQIVSKLETDDIEISIFLQRLLSLLERITKKLELASALPLLLLHPEVPQILTRKEMKIVTDVFSTYVNVETYQASSVKVSNNLRNAVHYKEDRDFLHSPVTDDIKIYEALKILNGYSEIRSIVKSFRKEISTQSELFLQYMKFFIEYVVTRLRLTPEQERSRELRYRKLWRDNAKAKMDMTMLTMQLDEQRFRHSTEIEVMNSQYNKDLAMVERINKICSQDVKHSMIKSERRQVAAYKNSEFKQNDLQQILLNTKGQLETLCTTNLRLERDIRNKKFKAESQLLALINKFDTEIGERQKILEELTNEFVAITNEREQLEEEMKVQLELHQSLVKEQEEASLKMFNEKLDTFIKSRAVKIIQRWWRKIYWRWKFKPKTLKKGKKKN